MRHSCANDVTNQLNTIILQADFFGAKTQQQKEPEERVAN